MGPYSFVFWVAVVVFVLMGVMALLEGRVGRRG